MMMANRIFPYVDLQPFEEESFFSRDNENLLELVELDLDLETETIRLDKYGNILLVYKDDALKIWIYKAIKTVRYRYVAYTWNYGCEIEKLIGQPNTRELNESEIERYVREALEINPYINLIYNFSFEYKNDQIYCNFSVDSVYGKVGFNFRV